MSPLQAQYAAKYGPGNYVPNVFIQYWGMRVMAYLAVIVVLVGAVGALAEPAQETRHVQALPVGGAPGWWCCRS